jgi:ubiquitin carboxyl-terminal hydrolase 25/28
LAVVRQLRLLFLQLYKSESSSVRPDEELAYLAITRPEIDQIVEPETAPQRITLDTIPDIPSASSTRVNSPVASPTIPTASLPGSPVFDAEASSVLGKRASTERDDSSRSSGEHTRQKSEGYDDLSGAIMLEPPSAKQDTAAGDEMDRPAESPSAITDLGALKLKSPELEDKPKEATVPPPLPARPGPPTRKDTLASGLRFGLQQDSAEVLINVLSQLEMAFDPATAEGEASGPNLISEWVPCDQRAAGETYD